MAAKTRAVVAIADDVGYTDENGAPHYVTRGTEFDIPEKDWERHGVRSDEQLDQGNYPAVVEADHPHVDALTSPVSAAEDPRISLARLRAIHGGSAGFLLDPAGNPVHVPSTTPAPAVRAGGLTVDWNQLNKTQLEAVADAAGIDASGKTKDELVAALSGAAADAGVTPRVGSPASETAAETPAEG